MDDLVLRAHATALDYTYAALERYALSERALALSRGEAVQIGNIGLQLPVAAFNAAEGISQRQLEQPVTRGVED